MVRLPPEPSQGHSPAATTGGPLSQSHDTSNRKPCSTGSRPRPRLLTRASRTLEFPAIGLVHICTVVQRNWSCQQRSTPQQARPSDGPAGLQSIGMSRTHCGRIAEKAPPASVSTPTVRTSHSASVRRKAPEEMDNSSFLLHDSNMMKSGRCMQLRTHLPRQCRRGRIVRRSCYRQARSEEAARPAAARRRRVQVVATVAAAASSCWRIQRCAGSFW